MTCHLTLNRLQKSDGQTKNKHSNNNKPQVRDKVFAFGHSVTVPQAGQRSLKDKVTCCQCYKKVCVLEQRF